MHNTLSRLMGISALKTVSRNMENSRINWRKTVEKQEFTPYVFSQYLETYLIFLKTHFSYRLVFALKILFKFCFSNSLNFFWVIFMGFFVNFSFSFQYILQRFSALKFPLNATEYDAYKIVYPALKVYRKWRL